MDVVPWPSPAMLSNVASMVLLGIDIFPNLLAVTMKTYSRAVHVHRRNQTQQYHRRIQKKWDKRSGTYTVTLPAAYVATLCNRQVIFAHPQVYARIKEAARAA